MRTAFVLYMRQKAERSMVGLSLLEREGVPQNQVIEFSEEGRTCHVEFRGCDEGGEAF